MDFGQQPLTEELQILALDLHLRFKITTNGIIYNNYHQYNFSTRDSNTEWIFLENPDKIRNHTNPNEMKTVKTKYDPSTSN